eukprot:11739437-Alexandrium_andersonii.AAC.1
MDRFDFERAGISVADDGKAAKFFLPFAGVPSHIVEEAIRNEEDTNADWNAPVRLFHGTCWHFLYS